MPIRTRRNSLPIWASTERRPLWPAVPPPIFTLTLNGARSSSSWKTVTSPMSFLKKSIAARTEPPLSFMKVSGFSSRMRSVPIRPCRTQPRKAFFGGSKPCTAPIASTAMNPTLWRCIAWRAPGLPRPIQICTGAKSPQSATGSASSGWPGTSTGRAPKKEPNQRRTDKARDPLALGRFAFAFFLADHGHFGSGRLRNFLVFGPHHGRSDDRGDREITVGDRRFGAGGKLDVADVDRIADVETGQVDLDIVGHLGGVLNAVRHE